MHGIIHTSAWAYTYVRVSLHVRTCELTRTYVQAYTNVRVE